MRPIDDPTFLTAEQRRRELAGILATGVLRQRQLRRLTGELAACPQEIVAKSAAACLEVSGETVLSVHTG